LLSHIETPFSFSCRRRSRRDGHAISPIFSFDAATASCRLPPPFSILLSFFRRDIFFDAASLFSIFTPLLADAADFRLFREFRLLMLRYYADIFIFHFDA